VSNSVEAAGGPPVSVRTATPNDLSAVRELLQDAGLPTAGVEQSLPRFVIAEADGRVVGTAGLELYGAAALLRSVAVRPTFRGSGLGRVLVNRLLGQAEASGIAQVYLLTTTAERYFPRLGFARITREQVPPAVRASVEFTEACPASAAVMRKVLSRDAP
jgi:amino-acid N-acetyltransferase